MLILRVNIAWVPLVSFFNLIIKLALAVASIRVLVLFELVLLVLMLLVLKLVLRQLMDHLR